MFKPVSAVCLFLTASALLASPDREPGPARDVQPVHKAQQGIAYRLEVIIPNDRQTHVVEFTLNDSEKHMVASDRFTFRLAAKASQLVNPIFVLFSSDGSYAAAQLKAQRALITVDGKIFDETSFADFQGRAIDLSTVDPSRVAFGAPFVRAAAKRPVLQVQPDPVAAAAARRLRLTPNTDTWNGCNDDDYCYAQWNYCNENCSPYDPYLPCSACNSNLEACTGGIETNSWSENTYVSQAFVQYVCDVNATTHTYAQFDQTWRHREYQTWLCQEADGDHYTTINTVDYNFHQYCYLFSANSCVGNPFALITCTE